MEVNRSSMNLKDCSSPRKGKNKRKQDDRSQSHASGSRRTRSQLDPNWTTKDELILVNEVAAVDVDCKKALSTYQKWKIVAGNCTSLGVPRTLNQYRRKWDSLLVEYTKIKEYEPQLNGTSYWLLDGQSRKEFGFPENFNEEVFDAINVFLRAQGVLSDTDPDSDPEPEADMLDAISELDLKKQNQQLVLREHSSEAKGPDNHTEENHVRNPIEEMTQNLCIERKPSNSLTKEKPGKSCVEEKEKMMAAKLRENAEFINAIVKGTFFENADFGASDYRNEGDMHTDFVRCQGDKLIACLGNISETLNQLCDLVKECE